MWFAEGGQDGVGLTIETVRGIKMSNRSYNTNHRKPCQRICAPKNK